jgi:hypothetical protein
VIRGAHGEEPLLEADGRVTLRFSEPLDPRAVARARFALEGPWSDAAHAFEKSPRMKARLADNQKEAVVELELAVPSPAPLARGNAYSVLLEPAVLRDLGGHRLELREDPAHPWVELRLSR